MDNKLFELAAKRRSVRKYTNEKIDDAVINEIMKVALTAPSSFGHQPVEFVVVRNKQTIREIAACILFCIRLLLKRLLQILPARAFFHDVNGLLRQHGYAIFA